MVLKQRYMQKQSKPSYQQVADDPYLMSFVDSPSQDAQAW